MAIAIIARTYREARYEADKRLLVRRAWFYAGTPEACLGKRVTNIISLPGWNKVPNVEEIVWILHDRLSREEDPNLKEKLGALAAWMARK